MLTDPDKITKPEAFKNNNYNSFLATSQFKVTRDKNGNEVKVALNGKVIKNSTVYSGNRYFIQ